MRATGVVVICLFVFFCCCCLLCFVMVEGMWQAESKGTLAFISLFLIIDVGLLPHSFCVLRAITSYLELVKCRVKVSNADAH